MYISDMRYKEVINLHNGERLGFVCDALADPMTGRLTALIIPGRYRFFGLFGREDDYVIPWEQISRLGDDIVLIDVQGELQRDKRKKRSAF